MYLKLSFSTNSSVIYRLLIYKIISMSLNLQTLLELTKILYEENGSEIRVEKNLLEKNYSDTKDSKPRSYVVQLGSSTLILSKTNPCSDGEGQEIINQMIELEGQKKLYNQVFEKKEPLASSELGLLVRGGSNNLPEGDMDETLKESVEFEKLRKSVASKSVGDSESLSDRSFNKILIGVLNNLEPIIGSPKFLRLLAETQKPVKSELPISIEAPSKVGMDPELQKASTKKSPSIFAEALAPVNPH